MRLSCCSVVRVRRRRHRGCGEGRVDQGGDIVPSDRQVGLGEGHLDVRDERAEELPVAVHLCEDVAMAVLDRSTEGGTDAEPAGDDLADWVQPNTQGIARRSERSPPPLRRDGREPMFIAPSSSTGVAVLKYSTSPSCSTNARYRAKAAVDMVSITPFHAATSSGALRGLR